MPGQLPHTLHVSDQELGAAGQPLRSFRLLGKSREKPPGTCNVSLEGFSQHFPMRLPGSSPEGPPEVLQRVLRQAFPRPSNALL
eukprot:252470-Pyramimonas_sp.AAC.1